MQSNKINPDTGEAQDLPEERVVEDQLCRETVRKKVPIKDADDSERAQDGGYESNNAGEFLQEQRGNLPKAVLSNPLLDLKPYMRGISEWDQRLARLE